MQKRDVFNSPRLREIHKKKNRVVRNKAIMVSVLSVILFIALGLFSRWPKVNILGVEVTGAKTVSMPNIEHTARETLSGYYLWLFPKTNFMIYPKSKVEESIANEFTRLTNIEVALKNMNTLSVSVAEREAVHTWCGDELPGLEVRPEEAKCYFMDDSGYIFDDALYFSGAVYFRFFGAVEKQAGDPRGFYFFPELWDDLGSFLGNIEEMGVRASALWIKEDGDIEIYLLSDELPPNAPKIVLKKNSDFTKMAENLQTALATEPLKTDFRKNYASLLYLDLRFGNKVIFKFK